MAWFDYAFSDSARRRLRRGACGCSHAGLIFVLSEIRSDQPGMTRLEFDNGLQLVRESLITMTGRVTEAVQAATTALLDRDLKAARATAWWERELEADRMLIQRHTMELLAQRPVAREQRMLVSAIEISAECWRMGLLAHHIGMAARHFFPVAAIPE